MVNGRRLAAYIEVQVLLGIGYTLCSCQASLDTSLWNDRLGLTVMSGLLVLLLFRILFLKKSLSGKQSEFEAQRKHSEEQEIQFQQILDATTDLILVKGAKSRLIWANRSFREYYGMSNEQLKGLVDSPVVDAAITEKYMRDDEWVFSKGKSLIIKREPITSATGEITYVNTIKSPIFDSKGQVIMSIGVSRDMSEQDRTEQRLRDSEANLRLALEAGKIGTWIWNNRLRHVDTSELLCSILGIPRQRGQTGIEIFFEHVVPEDLEAVQQAFHHCLLHQQGFQCEYRIILASGEMRWVYNRAEVTFDSQDEIEFKVAGVLMDISSRKKFEATIIEQQSQLAATAKLASLGEMAGGIAHEINNPLAIIDGKSRQLKMMLEREELPREKLVAAVELISSTTDRISRIVKGMLSLSRSIDSDPFNPVLVAHIVEEALLLSANRFKHFQVELSADAIPPGLQMECRTAQIIQVLLNLLSNAFDAVEGTPMAWVRVEFMECDGDIQLAVSDSGKGIPVAIQDKMFQPFFTSKPIGKGTGLGLSTSKRIVEDHGGEFKLDRNCAHTRFVMRLPLKQVSKNMMSHKSS